MRRVERLKFPCNITKTSSVVHVGCKQCNRCALPKSRCSMSISSLWNVAPALAVLLTPSIYTKLYKTHVNTNTHHKAKCSLVLGLLSSSNFKRLAVAHPCSQLSAQFCSSGQIRAQQVCYSWFAIMWDLRWGYTCELHLPSSGSLLCPQARNVHLYPRLLSVPSETAFLDDLWNMRSCYTSWLQAVLIRRRLIHQVVEWQCHPHLCLPQTL